MRFIRRKVDASKPGRMRREQQMARHEHAVLPKAVVRLASIHADCNDDGCVEQEVCWKSALSWRARGVLQGDDSCLDAGISYDHEAARLPVHGRWGATSQI